MVIYRKAIVARGSDCRSRQTMRNICGTLPLEVRNFPTDTRPKSNFLEKAEPQKERPNKNIVREVISLFSLICPLFADHNYFGIYS